MGSACNNRETFKNSSSQILRTHEDQQDLDSYLNDQLDQNDAVQKQIKKIQKISGKSKQTGYYPQCKSSNSFYQSTGQTYAPEKRAPLQQYVSATNNSHSRKPEAQKKTINLKGSSVLHNIKKKINNSMVMKSNNSKSIANNSTSQSYSHRDYAGSKAATNAINLKVYMNSPKIRIQEVITP